MDQNILNAKLANDFFVTDFEGDWAIHVTLNMTEFQLKSDNAVYWAGMPCRLGRVEQGTLPEILKVISRLNSAALQTPDIFNPSSIEVDGDNWIEVTI